MMKKMVIILCISVLGIISLVMPGSAQTDHGCINFFPGSGILDGSGGANFDNCCQGELNVPQSEWSEVDIWWEQVTPVERMMTPLNGATIVNLGVVDFNTITLDQLAHFSYSTTPIPGNDDSTNQLVNGDVFIIHTTDGNYVKVKVLEYGYTINLQFVIIYNWASSCVPEFPSFFLPATMIIGFLGAVLFIKSTGEN
jgi:hypothetical protein